MTDHLLKCFFTILLISLLLVVLTFANLNSKSANEDEDAQFKEFYEKVDKKDWVDHGDMFTWDPVTKTNREQRLKDMASDLIKKAKERRKITNEGEQNSCYSDCVEISTQLKNCELAQKQSRCDCVMNDECGKRSYQIIRRLVLLLDKQLKRKYSRGSILELKVNLDDILFEMPENINNSSDCDYLSNLHPLIDQILPLIVVYHPESFLQSEYLSPQTIGTSVGSLMVTMIWIKMSPRYKLISIFIFFWIVVIIWEWLYLYHTEKAMIEEKLIRFKDKCESQAQTNWFGWVSDMMPDLTFKSQVSECTDYYIATRVHPLLTVNPVKALSKVYEVTFLYALKLTANATGASFSIFLSHIPWIWILPVMFGIFYMGYTLIRYCLKYHYKYKPMRKVKSQKMPKSLGESEGIDRIEGSVRQRTDRIKLKSDTKAKKPKIDFSIARYGSTGNIQKLFI